MPVPVVPTPRHLSSDGSLDLIRGRPPATAPSRRERLRMEVLAEIREHGYAQIAEGGPTALSLNGIARSMGMSGPALYRYFASRDELLVTLITESYKDLAGTLGEVARRDRGGEPQERLRAALDACRQWALAQPHRYRLVFASSYGSGALHPDRIIPAAQRSATGTADGRVGWPEGFSPSGSHGSRRDSLLSPGSYHPGHQAVQTHLQCVNSVGEARVNPANRCREARTPASRRYLLRIQRTR